MEIGEFIAARLDEDEQDAWAAVPGGQHSAGPVSWEARWTSKAPPITAWKVVWADHEGPAYTEASSAKSGFAHHAARQDPRATLARVAALRALVAEHVPAPLVTGSTWLECARCIDVREEREDWPCDGIRGIAAIWAWHEDYQAGWKP